MEVPTPVTDQSTHSRRRTTLDVDHVASRPAPVESEHGLLVGTRSEACFMPQPQVCVRRRHSWTKCVALRWLPHVLTMPDVAGNVSAPARPARSPVPVLRTNHARTRQTQL
jgi:hypothetical protein